MEDKDKKEVDFNEALRRIANTPRDVVVKKPLVNNGVDTYNEKRPVEKPAPAIKKIT